MFTALRRLLLYRLLGGRIVIAMALLGLARRLLGRDRPRSNAPRA